MPGEILIVIASRDGEDTTSLKMIVNNKSSIENQIGELESEVTSNPAESRIEEALVNQNTLRLNADPLYADNNLGVMEDVEPNENTENQSEVIDETFDNTNLPLG